LKTGNDSGPIEKDVEKSRTLKKEIGEGQEKTVASIKADILREIEKLKKQKSSSSK
jgi:hypothetical protein